MEDQFNRLNILELPELGTIVLWILRSLIDFDLLLICRFI